MHSTAIEDATQMSPEAIVMMNLRGNMIEFLTLGIRPSRKKLNFCEAASQKCSTNTELSQEGKDITAVPG
jgi:hypothetical protein